MANSSISCSQNLDAYYRDDGAQAPLDNWRLAHSRQSGVQAHGCPVAQQETKQRSEPVIEDPDWSSAKQAMAEETKETGRQESEDQTGRYVPDDLDRMIPPPRTSSPW